MESTTLTRLAFAAASSPDAAALSGLRVGFWAALCLLTSLSLALGLAALALVSRGPHAAKAAPPAAAAPLPARPPRAGPGYRRPRRAFRPRRRAARGACAARRRGRRVIRDVPFHHVTNHTLARCFSRPAARAACPSMADAVPPKPGPPAAGPAPSGVAPLPAAPMSAAPVSAAALLAFADRFLTPSLDLRANVAIPFALRKGDAGFEAFDAYWNWVELYLARLPPASAATLFAGDRLWRELEAATPASDAGTRAQLRLWRDEFSSGTSAGGLRDLVRTHCCGSSSRGARDLYEAALSSYARAPLSMPFAGHVSHFAAFVRRATDAAPFLGSLWASDARTLLYRLLDTAPRQVASRGRALTGCLRSSAYHEWILASHLCRLCGLQISEPAPARLRPASRTTAELEAAWVEFSRELEAARESAVRASLPTRSGTPPARDRDANEWESDSEWETGSGESEPDSTPLSPASPASNASARLPPPSSGAPAGASPRSSSPPVAASDSPTRAPHTGTARQTTLSGIPFGSCAYCGLPDHKVAACPSPLEGRPPPSTPALVSFREQLGVTQLVTSVARVAGSVRTERRRAADLRHARS